MLLPLEMLSTGEWAEIEEINGEPGWVSRMAELGLRAGSRVQVLCSGSPCLLQVAGCRLCLRGECAAQVLARPVPVSA